MTVSNVTEMHLRFCNDPVANAVCFKQGEER